jgi:hypothetical protein
LAGIEEAGEHTLCEDVRFDQTRNNFKGNDFVGVRIASHFSKSTWNKRESHQFPEPGTMNLRLGPCTYDFLETGTLLNHVRKFPEFSSLFRVNADNSVDFCFRDSSIAFLFCKCGGCQ